jgi:predicted RNA-binding protein with PUA-like domain
MELGDEKSRKCDMNYWLMKSEPDVFSFNDLKALGDHGTEWSGVRNYLARNHMRAMALGDRVFFYHSNIGLEIVGIATVIALSHPDSTIEDARWDCVDIKAVDSLPKPVTLKDVKANPALSNMALVTSMRLSVQPVKESEWLEIMRMASF